MHRADIPIATPCDADWSTMTLADRGRFCGACRKVVRELRQMTEGEARALLASPPTEGLCVRFIHDERGEIVFRRDVVPLARLARRAAAVVLTVAMPLSAAACGGEQALTGSPAVPSGCALRNGVTPPPEAVMMGGVRPPDPPPPADNPVAKPGVEAPR